MKKSFAIIISLLILASCKDECNEYSDFNCAEIQKAEYNVFFYFPDKTEKSLGQTTGLSSCGNMAHEYAYNNHLSTNNDWGYVCCMIANGSSCYEKHR